MQSLHFALMALRIERGGFLTLAVFRFAATGAPLQWLVHDLNNSVERLVDAF